MKGRLGLVIMMLCGVVVLSAQDEIAVGTTLAQGREEIQLGQVLLETDFSSDTGWYTANTERRFLGVEDGRYRIEHTTRNTPMRGLSDFAFDDTVISVQTTQLSEENDNGYGVVCRANPDQDNTGYYFFINGEGEARIFTYEDFELVDLAEWTPVDAINTGQGGNEIVAVCSNTYLALYINGEFALDAYSDVYRYGRVGLIASTYVSQTPVNIAFSDLRVYAASMGEQPFEPTYPAGLQSIPDGWHATIAELERTGAIPFGGQVILVQDHLTINSTGANFEPMLQDRLYSDFVFSGNLTLAEAREEYAECAFISRVRGDSGGTIRNYFEVSIWQYQIEGFSDSDILNYTYDRFSYNVEIGVPVHVLYIMQGERATVYIDGVRRFNGMGVDDVAGYHGLMVRGDDEGGICEGDSIRIYALPEVNEGQCTLSSRTTTDRYTGPGLERAGIIPALLQIDVIGQFTAEDDRRWFFLRDETWVEASFVNLRGDCATIPEVSP